MTGHLGTRVSALLDGRMGQQEEERAWAHVHDCHPCRDLVEREGWVKTRLAELSLGPSGASERLKSSLLAPCPAESGWDDEPVRHRQRGLVALSGGAAGAAMVGVLALSMAPGSVPVERRAPVTELVRPSPVVQISRPTQGPTLDPARDATRPAADARSGSAASPRGTLLARPSGAR